MSLIDRVVCCGVMVGIAAILELDLVVCMLILIYLDFGEWREKS